MSIPLSMVVRLRIRLSQKIAVIAIFALALFITAIDITRLVVIVINPASLDNFLTWDPLECAIVILVANLPILRPLFFKREIAQGANGLRSSSVCTRLLRRKRRRIVPWGSLTTDNSTGQEKVPGSL